MSALPLAEPLASHNGRLRSFLAANDAMLDMHRVANGCVAAAHMITKRSFKSVPAMPGDAAVAASMANELSERIMAGVKAIGLPLPLSLNCNLYYWIAFTGSYRHG